MIYEGIDRWNDNSYLAHYKYIKKIKIGPYTRYFYSIDDLKNYYKTANEADSRATNKAFGGDYQYDLARAAVNNDVTKTFLGDHNTKVLKKTIDSAQKTKNMYKIGSKISNAMETGALAVSSMFGSDSKRELKMRETSTYKHNRNRKRKQSKKLAKRLSGKIDAILSSRLNY